jgi:hypothetical protein
LHSIFFITVVKIVERYAFECRNNVHTHFKWPHCLTAPLVGICFDLHMSGCQSSEMTLLASYLSSTEIYVQSRGSFALSQPGARIAFMGVVSNSLSAAEQLTNFSDNSRLCGFNPLSRKPTLQAVFI